MKNYLLHLILLFGLTNNIYAQNDNKLSTLSITPNQKTVPFRLFPTQNAKVFIKLNTRTGQMWQLHFGQDNSQQFVYNLNEQPLVKNTYEGNDRFTLYPTQLFYTFILLDQLSGKTWQVDWSNDPQKRILVAIVH